MEQKTILLTGATGHLGLNIIDQLLEKKYRILALVLPGDVNATRLPSVIEQVIGNICSPNDIENFFSLAPKGDVYVIHCAALITIYSNYNQKVYDVNVTGTSNIVDACVNHHVKKLVHVSSVHAIKELPKGTLMSETVDFNPKKIIGFYGKTKAEATKIVFDAVKNRGLNASVVFPGGLCGPKDFTKGSFTQLMIDCLKQKMKIGIKGGYDFSDVRDTASGIISCLEKGRVGEGYILGNRYVPLKEIFHQIHLITGIKEVTKMIPRWIAMMATPLMEYISKKRKKPPVFTSYSIHTATTNSQFSSKKAHDELGYKNRPFIETIKDTIAWLKGDGRYLMD